MWHKNNYWISIREKRKTKKQNSLITITFTFLVRYIYKTIFVLYFLTENYGTYNRFIKVIWQKISRYYISSFQIYNHNIYEKQAHFWSKRKSVFALLSVITVFKNKLLTKVDARTNGRRYENRCIKRPSQLWWFRSIS